MKQGNKTQKDIREFKKNLKLKNEQIIQIIKLKEQKEKELRDAKNSSWSVYIPKLGSKMFSLIKKSVTSKKQIKPLEDLSATAMNRQSMMLEETIRRNQMSSQMDKSPDREMDSNDEIHRHQIK